MDQSEPALHAVPADGEPPREAPPVVGTPAGRMDRVVSVLERVVPVARIVRAIVTAWAVAAALAVATFAVAAVASGPELNRIGWFFGAVLVCTLLTPSLGLLGLQLILTTVVRLPERLRREPGLRKDQLAQLSGLASGRNPHTGVRDVRRSRRSWQAGRLLVSARGDLLEYALALRILSLPYLVLSAGAFAAAMVEVVVLPLVALAFVLT